MPLRENKERPQSSQEIIVTARGQAQLVEERGDIIRGNGVHVAVECFPKRAEPVTQIGKINLAHTFRGLCGDRLINRRCNVFAFNPA